VYKKGNTKMNVTINCNFDFDGIEDCKSKEIIDYLKTALEYGAESSSSEINNITININN